MGNIGNYVSVGFTTSPDFPYTEDCDSNEADIYVVKADRLGRVIWQRAYDIGGNDVAYDVIELTNGDVALCGETENIGTECDTGQAVLRPDAFIMRLNINTGAVIWCCTYGSDTTWDGFRRLIQTRFAPVGGGMNQVGDLAAAGWSSPTQNLVNSDGYMVRVRQANGALVWNNTYGGTRSDRFRSIIETRVVGFQGDFVAVGASNSWSTTAVDNAWIVRCNGGNGAVGVGPRRSAVYGDTIRCSLWSVVELTVNYDSAALVYTGSILVDPTLDFDIYMLKTAPNPCFYIKDLIIFSGGFIDEEATTIRELRGVPSNPYLPNGVLYNCGYSDRRPNYNGDAYVTLIDPFTLGAIGSVYHVYGARSDEVAWYIDYVPTVAGQSTQGFYVTGWSFNTGAAPSYPLGADPGQLYAFKTDNRLYTGCCDTIYTVDSLQPDLPDSCVYLQPYPFGRRCCVTVRRDTIRRWRIICNDSLNIHNCQPDTIPPDTIITPPDTIITPPDTIIVPPAPGRLEDLSNHLGAATSRVRREVTPWISRALAISSSPNPIPRGGLLSLRYDLRLASRVLIQVTDMTGREIYRQEEDQRAGSTLVRLSTAEWRVGAYLIRVTAAGESETRRIVVSDR